MASFPGAVKSFTTKNAGDTIQPADVNDLQDEVNAIESGYINGTAHLHSSASTVASLSVGGKSTFAGSVTFNAAVASTVVALTDGANVALNAALGNVFKLIAAGDRTISVPTNPGAGQKIIIRHMAATAARTLTLSTSAGGFRFGTDIGSLSQTSSGKTDYIGCIYNSSASFWDVVAYSKGY